MTRYVAFLRAVNVGGRTVKMEQLKRLLESAGLSDVRTFIASGNVIFRSPSKSIGALEGKIESHLLKTLGYTVTTFIRSEAEVSRIAKHDAFGAAADDGATVYIAFLHSEPERESGKRLLASRSKVNDFRIHKNEVYWLCNKRMMESDFSGAMLEKILGMPATLRNSTTIRRLSVLLSEKKPGETA